MQCFKSKQEQMQWLVTALTSFQTLFSANNSRTIEQSLYSSCKSGTSGCI